MFPWQQKKSTAPWNPWENDRNTFKPWYTTEIHVHYDNLHHLERWKYSARKTQLRKNCLDNGHVRSAVSAKPETDQVLCNVDVTTAVQRKLALGWADTDSHSSAEDQLFLGVHHKFCVYAVPPIPTKRHIKLQRKVSSWHRKGYR